MCGKKPELLLRLFLFKILRRLSARFKFYLRQKNITHLWADAHKKLNLRFRPRRRRMGFLRPQFQGRQIRGPYWHQCFLQIRHG